MPFRAIIDEVPKDLQVVADGPNWVVAIPLTHDGPLHASLVVSLKPRILTGVPVQELAFAIVVVDANSGEWDEIHDRDKASPYIEDVKHLVMSCVCAAAEELIKSVRPKHIYGAAAVPLSPSKTLAKHQTVVEVVTKLGYDEPRSGMTTDHRPSWISTRTGESDGEE